MRAILGLLLLVMVDEGLSLTKATGSTRRVTTTEMPDQDITEEFGDSVAYPISDLEDEEVENAEEVQTEKPKPANSSCCTNPFFVAVPGLITVSDDIPVSTVIARVEAADPDSKKHRKIIYRFTYYDDEIFETFTVDENTGEIRTKARLDTAPFQGENATEYLIILYTEFQNGPSHGDISDMNEGIWALRDGQRESVEVWIRALHGNFRDLLHEPNPSKTESVTNAVVESSWNDKEWLQIGLGIFDIVGGTIVILWILRIIYKAKKYRSSTPPSPKCVQVAADSAD